MNTSHKPSRLAGALAAGCLAFATLSAVAQNLPALPPVQQQGQVEFLTGGFGADESNAIKAASSQYPLALTFSSTQGGAYVANVKVRITDARGNTVLDTTGGPYVLVKLPAGRYKVSATFNGKEQTRQISVPRSGTARAGFTWNT
ncbi:carboxypeptidase-like regulatory domain-containing protein [Bordetella sp. 15P40C-2]|uniref:carboxypeptidase-like regulatory domain-containing protein n=1 Tax=Bordetella sp. 15P40C-2 TaxID=2572246 RepID=UPI0013233865|nr:carboxypeptidase-like regulatory domain-containing protein [Bordetella sp. 15P40C-2]MVW72734.1 carboxypeptidase regulatory-like domain-containing protein [Bordetella sp. 15P40C-2]